MISKDIFKAVVEIVKKAHENEETDLDQLIEMGFNVKDLNDGVRYPSRVPNLLYTRVEKDGGRVEVNYYAYDPTKPFSKIEPDINKFYVYLIDSDERKLDEFHISFSDRP